MDISSLNLELRNYKIPKEKLPKDSFLDTGRLTANLQPFSVWGPDPANLESYRQLNWTNFFLWKKLGGISNADSQILKQIIQIGSVDKTDKESLKGLANKLSDDFIQIKQKINILSTLNDLDKIKEMISLKEISLLTVIEGLQRLENRIENLEKVICSIGQSLGIQSKEYSPAFKPDE